MAVDGYRWQMTAPHAPLARAAGRFTPAHDEVVVAVAGCGVCHTDLGYLHGDVRTHRALPLALGHEISGTVVDAGDDARAMIGRAVIVPAVLPCGECEACRRGLGTICSRQKMPGNDIEGGFATHIVVPARGLCDVDRDRLERAGLTLAEVAIVADAVTTPYQAVRRAGVRPGSLAVVVGAGGVGGFCVQIARASGAIVVAIDVDPERLAQIEAHGASLAIDARGRDARAIKSEVAKFAEERGVPAIEWLIFECSGTAAGQLTAYGLLVHGATLAVVGFTMEKIEIRLSNLMAFDARALGNWGCPPELYPAALDLVLDRRIEVKPFIETRPLDAINDVLAAAGRHELRRRAVLVPA